MDHDSLRLLEPKSTFDQFIIGAVEIPNGVTATLYDKDRIIEHLTQEIINEGESDQDRAQIDAVEHFYFNMHPACPPYILFCSHDDYTLILDMGEDDER